MVAISFYLYYNIYNLEIEIGKGENKIRHKSIKFDDSTLYLLDQRKLPGEIEYFKASTFRDVEYAIIEMVVRGAPAIGATAAYGVYLAALEYKDLPDHDFYKQVLKSDKILADTRPTAVNLVWAINRMEWVLENNIEIGRETILSSLLEEANNIADEDIEINRQMAKNGNEIVNNNTKILTHCNTGSLATVDYGTALGVIRMAHQSGKNIRVYVDETRPRLQGARLTAFELVEEGIPAVLIVDSAAATLMRKKEIDLVLVGADRITANGDTANKIGTYMLSELAVRFNIPFYIVAPVSTIDFSINTGEEIEIEQRSSREVTHIDGSEIAPRNMKVYNPAFDITPAENITGIITEEGIIKPPLARGLANLSTKKQKETE